MINYTLKCDAGHSFDSWFASAAAFDGLARAGQLSCVHCGSTKVSKAIMTPRVAKGRSTAPEGAASGPALSAPANEAERALAALRRKIEANSDYVGDRFAKEARAMHAGDTPQRAIHGEARLDQARELIAEGVPLMPLPFRPKQKLS